MPKKNHTTNPALLPTIPDHSRQQAKNTGPHFSTLSLQHVQHLRTPDPTSHGGTPMRLTIDPSATPTAHHSPIPVPLHWQEEVKAGLDRDVRLGVIEQVPVGDPVTWCNRMVICAKKNGSLRRTIDFQPLNAHATRETHHMQSPFHQARSVPQGMKKTVFDTWNGYHSVNLHHEDRHYTPSSPHGGDTATEPHPKDTLLLEMVTPGGTMKSCHPSPTR